MRISRLIAPLLLLAGCHGGGAGEQVAEAPRTIPIACRIGGAAGFAQDCTVERQAAPGGMILTLGHKDGGFRRVTVTADGRGVIATDGAEPARVIVTGARSIEVVIGGDRYRLPATVKGAAKPAA